MPRNAYYLDELEYLRDMRQRAAREHWDIAGFLAKDASDPDVERLFEGFAFLTGRLREKLDDEFPEIIQSLLGLWWPHYLRPVPAMSVLEFTPVPNAFSETRVVPAGTEVQSIPVDGSRCLFRTSRSVALHPLGLEDLVVREHRSHAALELSFSVWPNAGFADTEDGLRFYLNDQLDRAADLYRFLLHHTRDVQAVCLSGGQPVARVELSSKAFSAPQRVEGEELLPETGSVASGYLGLQEYFCFPEHQLFVDLNGFGRIASALGEHGADQLVLTINFDRHLDFSGIREAQALRINCVPIVNLFEGTARPIPLEASHSEYPLVVERAKGMHCELYAVDACAGYVAGEREKKVFHRFESFEHQSDPTDRDYYRLRFAQAPQGGLGNAYVSFVVHSEPTARREQTVSVDLTCSNGNLPHALDPGDIRVSTSTSPEFATFKNLIRPSRHLEPPLGEHTLWQLVANMSANYTTLLNTDTLRTVLNTYDFKGKVDAPAGRRTAKQLGSLRVISSAPANRLYRGLPIRGVSTRLSVSRTDFRSLGAVYAFGCVLDEFLGSFAGLNSFHQLSLVDRDSDEVFKWLPRSGNRPIM